MTSAPQDDITLDPVATTARLTAAMRAQESRRPDRLIDDPLAATLAGEQGMAMLEHAAGGEIIAVRSHWFDRRVARAVDAGVHQVVVVAAGMDTRAWRLPWPRDAVVFELDRPATLALKARLVTGSSAPAGRRVAVGLDLTGAWPDELAAAGHDAPLPTCWLAEGLLQYLTAGDVERLFEKVTERSAPGSTLLYDVVGAALLEQLADTPMLNRFAAQGMPWTFGTDEPAALVTLHGWNVEVRPLGLEAAALGRGAPTGGGPDGYLCAAVR